MRSLALIANLAANNHRDQSSFDRFVLQYFKQLDYTISFYATSTAEELDESIHQSIQQGVEEYVTIGGDGSLHYLLNSIVKHTPQTHSIRIAVLPKGTGNDYIRNFNFPTKRAILSSIVQSSYQSIDIGEIEFTNSTKRYFINMLGIGFSAAVVKNVDKYKWVGSLAYYLAIVETFARYKSHPIEISIDNKKIAVECFWMCVGLGKYAGGNMKLCPDAKIDDGLFAIHIIQKISFWKLLRYIHTLRDGSYLNHIEVQSYQTQSLNIANINGLGIEADGELITQPVTKINLVAKAIQFICKK